MRPSKLKHPVAVLRKVIGLEQKRFAELIGCSASTIQGIELGPNRLKLSDALAQRIALETGVCVGWLKRGDASAPITTEDRQPYTREHFETAQVNLRGWNVSAEDMSNVLEVLRDAIEKISWLTIVTHSRQKHGLFAYKLDKALAELAREFGDDLNFQDGRKIVMDDENFVIRNGPAAKEGLRRVLLSKDTTIEHFFNFVRLIMKGQVPVMMGQVRKFLEASIKAERTRRSGERSKPPQPQPSEQSSPTSQAQSKTTRKPAPK